MKCQSLFSGKNKEKIINSSSAKFAHTIKFMAYVTSMDADQHVYMHCPLSNVC